MTAESCLPFEPRTAAMRELRNALRTGVRALEAGPGELLHARYTGAKPLNADVENLLLYNVDIGGATFADSTREGVRFEYSPGADGASYEYEIAGRNDTFRGVRPVRSLARFEAALDDTPSRLDRVWWAVRHADPELTDVPLSRGRPFSVRAVLTAPHDVLPARLLKPILDGIVAAFQSHTDPGSLALVSDRVAQRLGVGPDAVAVALADPAQAVLGQVHRLLHPWRTSVQWSPGDEHLVAGELLLERGDWAVRGEVVEVRLGDC